MVVEATKSLVTPLLAGLFPPFKDKNYSPDSALADLLFRLTRCEADGTPEAIDSQIPSNLLLYSFQ